MARDKSNIPDLPSKIRLSVIDLDIRELYPSAFKYELSTYMPRDICGLLNYGKLDLIIEQIVETVVGSKISLTMAARTNPIKMSDLYYAEH